MKTFYLLSALVFFTISVLASPVDSTAAKKVAQNFINGQLKVEVKEMALTYSQVTITGDTTLFYIFNCTSNNGWVIVSATNATSPILGYSISGSFPLENLPPAFVMWVGNYNNQILEAIRETQRPTEEVSSEWEILQSPIIRPTTKSVSSVDPLLTTTWDQGKYYNDWVPGDCATGCTATAMAQIMKFWGHPKNGFGDWCYQHPVYGSICANFGATTYAWSSMPNRLNSSNTAVATLLYHAGVSVNMNYCQNGKASGAWVLNSEGPNSAQRAYSTFFGYDGNTIQGKIRSNFSDRDWINILKDELIAGRPIQYVGDDNNLRVGHTWVADGFDSNSNFHFNWGWGGNADGWFKVSDLNPNIYHFDANQRALIGIQPGETNPDCTPATITTQPTNKTAAVGSAVTFSVSVSGTGPFSYFWYKNGSFLKSTTNTSSNTNSCTTSTLATGNDGDYYQVWINNCNDRQQVKSDIVYITVANACTPATITTQPRDKTVNVGSTATLSVSVSGTGPFSYFWYRNGSFLKNTTNSSSNSNSCTTPVLGAGDSGDFYQVWINNCNDLQQVKSDIAYVFVANACTPATITTQPTDQTATVGSTATLSVSVSGTGPFSYFWYRNGSFVKNTTNSSSNSNSCTTPTLDAGDDGDFYQVWINNCNDLQQVKSNTVYITVASACTPVYLSSQPADRTVIAGATATFSISVSGTSPYTYQWYKNGTMVSGASSASYTTPTLSISDNGNSYYCSSTNCNGNNTATSNSAILTVNPDCTPVEITAQPSSQTASVGGTATYGITASGSEPITYQWYKNGSPISSATSAVYITPILGLSDNGNTYHCLSKNCNGSYQVQSNSANLTIITNPCSLSVEPLNQMVTSQAGSKTFSVSSNCAWTAISSQPWCSVTLSGNGNGLLTANFGENSSSTDRTVTITVRVDGKAPVECTLTQSKTGGCLPPWQPVQNQQNVMNVIAKLYLSNELSSNPNDAIGCFVNNQCRGLAFPNATANGLIFLTISSDVQTGETISFKAWKSTTCEECVIAETIPFVNQTDVGSIAYPIDFHCGMSQLCISFGAGYTWFSVNVNPGSMALSSIFNDIIPCENDRIIGQTAFAVFNNGQWMGSLATINSESMYKMKLCSQQTLCIQGSPVSVSPLTIPGGYPWIGYLPQSDLPINSALANIVPAPLSNDRFSSQSSFATYSGTSWVGTLTSLQKGKGFIIHLESPSILRYPTGMDLLPITSEPSSPKPMTPNGDTLSPNSLYNMQIIARIILPDGSVSKNSLDAIYAYVGNQCRGIANVMQELDGRLFLTVGSDLDSGEEVTFKICIAGEKRVYEVRNSLIFSSDLETGTIDNPYLFNLNGLTGIPITENTSGIWVGQIYPNPIESISSVELILDKPGNLEGRIINDLGQVIRVVMDEKIGVGSYVLEFNSEGLPQGLYTLLITFLNDKTRSVFSRKMIIH